jgi:isochorismate synthase
MNTVTSVNTEIRSETELLDFLLNHAMENHLPIAFWRLPNTATRYLIIAHQHSAIDRNAPIEELPAGFMFSPFDREKSSLFLQADFIFRFEHEVLATPQTPAEIASAAWLAQKLKTSPLPASKPAARHGNVPPPVTAGEYHFTGLVQKCVDEIGTGKFEKVVPSRTRLINLPEDFDVVEAFEKLCSRYGNALISFVSIPGTGSWLGATPEVLVTVEDKTIFKTVALAGTMPYQEGTNLRSVAWTQKEIEEQALVERYVISCFKKIRLREYDEHGPKTVVAGNLMHLKSDFTVDMKATNFPQLGSVMLQLLHPTAAVCGMPLEPALEFLKEHEGYDREFYAGYLGPVNVNNNINLFVNLRCMKLLHNQARLYAGAGVTIDSLPDKEWEETEIKFNTLLNVIA